MHVDHAELRVTYLEVKTNRATLTAPSAAKTRSEVHRRTIRGIDLLDEGLAYEES